MQKKEETKTNLVALLLAHSQLHNDIIRMLEQWTTNPWIAVALKPKCDNDDDGDDDAAADDENENANETKAKCVCVISTGRMCLINCIKIVW